MHVNLSSIKMNDNFHDFNSDHQVKYINGKNNHSKNRYLSETPDLFLLKALFFIYSLTN